jgi:hypothetical protein
METKNPYTISFSRLRSWKDNIDIDIRKADQLVYMDWNFY